MEQDPDTIDMLDEHELRVELRKSLCENTKLLASLITAFAAGYESGHDDTVESCYTDAREAGRDWLNDALYDGTFE